MIPKLPNKNYNLNFEIEEGKEGDYDHVREVFLKNMTESKELRKDIFEKMYCEDGMQKQVKKQYLETAEKEWNTLNQKNKENWFDFVTDKNTSFVIDIAMIARILKDNKLNMRKAWKEVKQYGKSKNRK